MLHHGRVGTPGGRDWNHAGDGGSEDSLGHGVSPSRQATDAGWAGHGLAGDARITQHKLSCLRNKRLAISVEH